MNINDLALPPSADEGATLHLRHPAHGYPLYFGKDAGPGGRAKSGSDAKPVTVTVRSFDSEAVREAIRKDRKAAMKTPNAEAESPNLMDALIVAWDGIDGPDGKPWPCTRENKVAFMNRNPALNRQVTEFATDQAHFFDAAATT